MTIDHKLMRWFAKHQGEAAKEADIRRELGISHGTFHQARARLLAAGLLKRRKEGALYVYDLPDEAAAVFGSAGASPPLPKESEAAQASRPVRALRQLRRGAGRDPRARAGRELFLRQRRSRRREQRRAAYRHIQRRSPLGRRRA